MEMKSESKKVFWGKESFTFTIHENYRNWYFSILITTQHKIHESNIKKQVSNFDEILPVAVLWPMILGNRVIMVTSPLGHIIIELLYNTHIRQRYRARQVFLVSSMQRLGFLTCLLIIAIVPYFKGRARSIHLFFLSFFIPFLLIYKWSLAGGR